MQTASLENIAVKLCVVYKVTGLDIIIEILLLIFVKVIIGLLNINRKRNLKEVSITSFFPLPRMRAFPLSPCSLNHLVAQSFIPLCN